MRRAARSGALLGALLASSNWACTGVLDGGPAGVGVGTGRSPSPGGGTAGSVAVAAGPLDPGRVPMRRLNRAEYCNTVHDLLGTAQRPCDQFPEDNVMYGFDTISSVQSLSSLHMELYETAATALIDELMALPDTDPRRTSIFTCQPAAADPKPCALEILSGFATRAFRRPVAPSELTAYVALLDVAKAQSGTVNDGLALGLRAILLSPNFLFRVEIDPNPHSAALHPVADYELASRLSYALWSSQPDAALTASAAAGTLHDLAELGRQVARMLQDPKAHALTTDFIGQWLQLRKLPTVEVDPVAFPAFSSALRDAMGGETSRFFDEFFQKPLPVASILTADFTYLNSTLATYYGMAPPAGSDFVRVSLADSTRRGMLMQASILTVTSHPNRTSPVARGVWVLARLLCSEPSPPPPGVPLLAETPPGVTPDTTMRERLAAHRVRPECGACHNSIDPIGLGLENFDGIGRYRTTEGTLPIDAAGELPDGTMFSGPAELATILTQPERGFDACVTTQMLTYVVGRGFADDSGLAWSAHIADLGHTAGGSFGALLTSIVQSDLFTKRRGEAP
ncbi:MAG TPA: DUF1592 domain-containing protein [Polyangiaceae bacterium]|nr:DUF1592 domain-containing protein [Polyangiaceae bacterium]